MKNKVVGVTKPIYELVRALEENSDNIDFTVSYSFAEILSSYHFCPAFTINNVYYEIQYDDFDCLEVLDFGTNGYKSVGDIMTDDEIIELTNEILIQKIEL